MDRYLFIDINSLVTVKSRLELNTSVFNKNYIRHFNNILWRTMPKIILLRTKDYFIFPKYTPVYICNYLLRSNGINCYPLKYTCKVIDYTSCVNTWLNENVVVPYRAVVLANSAVLYNISLPKEALIEIPSTGISANNVIDVVKQLYILNYNIDIEKYT